MEDARLAEVMQQVHTLANASVDAVIPQGGLRLAAVTPEMRANGADPVYLQAQTGEGEVPIAVLDGGHDQLAEKLMPGAQKYYRRMLSEAPALLAQNVNTWLQREHNANRLLRMVKPAGLGAEATPARFESVGAPFALRAFLSDGYKQIDHHSVLKVLVPELNERSATVEEFNLSQKVLNVRVVTGAVDLTQRIQQARAQRDHTFVNEMVAFGVSVRNSETGHAAVTVEAFARILRCVNGLIVDEPFRLTHLGKRQDATEGWLQNDTRRLDDAAAIMRIRDRIRYTFSPEVQAKVAEGIITAAGEKIELGGASQVMKFVTNVGQRFDLSQGRAGSSAGHHDRRDGAGPGRTHRGEPLERVAGLHRPWLATLAGMRTAVSSGRWSWSGSAGRSCRILWRPYSRPERRAATREVSKGGLDSPPLHR